MLVSESHTLLITPPPPRKQPGVDPKTFAENAPVEMKVNTITSMHTQLPLDYYSMPFCEPDGGPKKASENLGEFITGNKIQSSPYHLYMLLENFCSVLCQKTLTAAQAKTLKKGEVDCVE
jgi:transmembrane 9 superfamily protein 2/4